MIFLKLLPELRFESLQHLLAFIGILIFGLCLSYFMVRYERKSNDTLGYYLKIASWINFTVFLGLSLVVVISVVADLAT